MTQTQKNSISNLVEILFKSTIRSSFSKIKVLKDKQIFISKAIPSLSFLERRKKDYFKTFKENCVMKKKVYEQNINAVSPIFNLFYLRNTRKAFEKIVKYNLPALKPAPKVKTKKSNAS